MFVKTNGFLSKPLFAGVGHVLCFHRVKNDNDRERIQANSGMEISEEKLRFILGYFIEKSYKFISMDQLVQRVSSGKHSEKFVVITFDDGFNDNYTHALPIFKELGIPFTVFISTAMPDNEMVLWPYFLEEYLLKSDLVEFQFHDRKYVLPCLSLTDKQDAFHKIRSVIIENERTSIPFFMNEVFKVSDQQSKDFTRKNALSWDQLKNLSSEDIVTIGAHCKNHFALSRLNEKDSIREIGESKSRLESELNRKIEHFAYPYGTYNEFLKRDIDNVRQAGYKTACTLLQGNVFDVHQRYLFQIPRIPLGENVNIEILESITNGVRQFSFNGWKRVI